MAKKSSSESGLHSSPEIEFFRSEWKGEEGRKGDLGREVRVLVCCDYERGIICFFAAL